METWYVFWIEVMDTCYMKNEEIYHDIVTMETGNKKSARIQQIW